MAKRSASVVSVWAALEWAWASESVSAPAECPTASTLSAGNHRRTRTRGRQDGDQASPEIDWESY